VGILLAQIFFSSETHARAVAASTQQRCGGQKGAGAALTTVCGLIAPRGRVVRHNSVLGEAWVDKAISAATGVKQCTGGGDQQQQQTMTMRRSIAADEAFFSPGACRKL